MIGTVIVNAVCMFIFCLCFLCVFSVSSCLANFHDKVYDATPPSPFVGEVSK